MCRSLPAGVEGAAAKRTKSTISATRIVGEAGLLGRSAHECVSGRGSRPNRYAPSVWSRAEQGLDRGSSSRPCSVREQREPILPTVTRKDTPASAGRLADALLARPPTQPRHPCWPDAPRAASASRSERRPPRRRRACQPVWATSAAGGGRWRRTPRRTRRRQLRCPHRPHTAMAPANPRVLRTTAAVAPSGRSRPRTSQRYTTSSSAAPTTSTAVFPAARRRRSSDPETRKRAREQYEEPDGEERTHHECHAQPLHGRRSGGLSVATSPVARPSCATTRSEVSTTVAHDRPSAARMIIVDAVCAEKFSRSAGRPPPAATRRDSHSQQPRGAGSVRRGRLRGARNR